MFRILTLITTTVIFMLVGLLIAYLTVEAVEFNGDETIAVFALYPLGGFVLGIITSLIAIKVAGSKKN